MMFKSLLSLLLLGAATLPAMAASDFVYEYNHHAKTAVITGTTGPLSGEIYLPRTVPAAPAGSAQSAYKVIGIKSGAINGMPELTKIVITANIEFIGNVSRTQNNKASAASLGNFVNCPKLEKIEVTDGNGFLAATGAGILTSLDGTQVYRVPPRIDVSKNNGTLKMSTTGVGIAENAFEGITTVSAITFSKNLEYVSPAAAFYTMKQLTDFVIPSGGTAEANFVVENHALIDKSNRTLISYPRGSRATTVYTVDPSLATHIASFAFAYTSLRKIVLPEGVSTIGDYAFTNSQITDMALPSTVSFDSMTGRGAFTSTSLSTFTWACKNSPYIPRDFMRGNIYLKSVKIAAVPAGIGTAAFKDCVSLASFAPFSARTELLGDSIWANSGLEQVVFEESEWNKAPLTEFPKGTFDRCRKLRKLDMSGIGVFTSKHCFVIPGDFANGCSALEEVVFPGFIEVIPGAFTGCHQVSKVVICDFIINAAPLFSYDSAMAVAPECYVLDPERCAGTFRTPVGKLFGNMGMGQLKPVFYFESLYPSLDALVPGSSTWVPGAVESRYPAPSATTSLGQLFSFSIAKADDKVLFTFHPQPFVKLDKLEVDLPGYFDLPADGGTVSIDISPSSLKMAKVFYTVNGIEMDSTYPEFLLPWEGMSSVDAPAPAEVYTSAEIFDLHGRHILSVGNPSGLGRLGLAPGIYIVRRTRADGSVSVDKLRL